jgi:uncharacterized protein DUF3455
MQGQEYCERIAAWEIFMIGRRIVLASAIPLLANVRISAAAEPLSAELQPPVGYKMVLTAKASGVQIYTSVAEAGNPAKWVFEAPLARLTDSHGKLIYHYAGPSWEAIDGSKVALDKDTPVKSVPAHNATNDIPWLLVKVVADPADGVLRNVGFVQRIATHGGVAPATAPVRAGTKIGVPYTATYAFFSKAA